MADSEVHRRALTAAALALAGGASAAAPAGAQEAREPDLAARVAMLEDRAALKRLVDTFSNLADVRQIDAQVLLFTEDATVQSWSAGARTSSLTGRAELAQAFSRFLAQFSTVYHINGQQTVTVNGDQATGICYCLVVLIGEQDGKTIRRTSGVRYEDAYVRRGGEWLIAARSSHFEWTDIAELAA